MKSHHGQFKKVGASNVCKYFEADIQGIHLLASVPVNNTKAPGRITLEVLPEQRETEKKKHDGE